MPKIPVFLRPSAAFRKGDNGSTIVQDWQTTVAT